MLPENQYYQATDQTHVLHSHVPHTNCNYRFMYVTCSCTRGMHAPGLRAYVHIARACLQCESVPSVPELLSQLCLTYTLAFGVQYGPECVAWAACYHPHMHHNLSLVDRQLDWLFPLWSRTEPMAALASWEQHTIGMLFLLVLPLAV